MWCNTLLQCVVWWIASGDHDEHYRGKNGLARGVLVLGELVWLGMNWISLSLDQLPPTVVASPIYRGPGPLPKY